MDIRCLSEWRQYVFHVCMLTSMTLRSSICVMLLFRSQEVWWRREEGDSCGLCQTQESSRLWLFPGSSTYWTKKKKKKQLCSVCVSTWSVVCSPAPFLIALRNRWGSASSSVWFNFSRHQQVLLGNNSQRWPWSDNTITKGANHNTLTRVANRQTQGWVHSQGSLVFVCPTLA